MRIKWKVAGSFDEFEEGEVIATLFWPDVLNHKLSEDIRAYVAKADSGNITVVQINMVVELEEVR